jgi:FdhD protein
MTEVRVHGRHKALDKVVGWALRAGLVGVGAPPSLAVDRGLTLCGFARDGRVNVYTGLERVQP